MSSTSSQRDPRLRSRATSAHPHQGPPSPLGTHPITRPIGSPLASPTAPLINPYSTQHLPSRPRDESQLREDQRNKRPDQPPGSSGYGSPSAHLLHDRTSKNSNEALKRRDSLTYDQEHQSDSSRGRTRPPNGYQTSTNGNEAGQPISRYRNPFTKLSEPTRSVSDPTTTTTATATPSSSSLTTARHVPASAVSTLPRTVMPGVTQAVHAEERSSYNHHSHEKRERSLDRRGDYDMNGRRDTKEKYDVPEKYDARDSCNGREDHDMKESYDARENHDTKESRDSRGRSKSRHRSRSRERGRSESKVGRSESRARSKSQHRGRSRSTRRTITMGEISNRRRRSLSRGTHFDSDIDLSDDEDYTRSDDSSDSEYSRNRQRSRSRRRSTSRGKKRRYTYISSDSEEAQRGILQSDTIGSRPSPRTSPDSVMANDPSDRFNRPMEMIIKMNSLMDKCSLQMELLNSTFRKMEAINKRFNIEMWEMRKELKSRVAPPTRASQSAPGSPQGEHQMGFQRSSSVSRSRNNSSQIDNIPPITTNKSESQRTVNPIQPPPSLQPAPPKKRAKTDEVVKEGTKSNSMVTIRVHPNTVRDAYHLSPTWRSTGYRRVFETSHYQIPIASQPALGVFSILNKKVIEKAIMGKAPRPMKFNPFSHQTQFEGIAATCSVDGSIQFWNINTREMVLSLPSRGTRIFPYAETLTWVSEDTIVVVSHLRLGSSWPEVPLNVVDMEPNSHSLPETQTNLITLYFNPDGKLGHRVVNITSKPHEKTISAVTAVMREDHSMSYITGGCDRALYHWKFHARSDENQGQYEPEGLKSVHKLHSNAISSVAYSHISKNLYSGGKDCRYICFSLEHEKVVKEVKLGYIIHINQNPVDPRISAVTLQSLADQYMLMDERTPGHQVLRLGYTHGHKPLKITHPSWHPEGGLFCSGTDVDGIVNVWDIRWSGIKNTYHQRPGSGIVTGDVQFDRVITASDAPPRHPIFRKRLPIEGYYRSTVGGPSQILELGGKKVLHAGFHPTKNVMIALNSDSSLTFMDYVMRTDPIA